MSIPNSPKSSRRLEPDEPSSRLAQPTAESETELAWLRPYVSDKTFIFISANLGLLFVACAQFFFACMNITVKYFLSKTSISVSTLILVRMGITSICCIVALHIIRDPNPVLGPPEVRRWLVYRGLAGLVGLFSAYKSYTGLTVSDSTSIQFLTPTLTSILGFLILGEKCSIREVVAGLASLGGVVLISRPPIIFGGSDNGEGLPPDESMPAVPNPNESTRMMGVFWALSSVCGSTAACGSDIPPASA
jgi:drug/metabolite transporter (DMT)-like permease